ncbi:TOBE domain-containing protein [Desulfosediminicola ganghwensis]|uniref:TOBE domain-containing protein n=1 Tax=Desulfosediminicola ganghwensis TaxID=2569540 RepID=UPI0010AD0215|nr:TOBE domain-containing protein [Desulfosediminicola ganghwensis]
MKTEDSIFEIMGWTANNTTVLLLEALDETGSINKAAQQVGLQYKSAWQKLDRMNNILPFQLYIKKTGGSGGGGSSLTEEGKGLLKRLRLLKNEYSQFTQFYSDNPNEALSTLKTLRRMEMTLSARNVWLGEVIEINQGAVNSVVDIRLKGGDRVSTVITERSVNRLGLGPLREVLVIVKAPNVLLGCDIDRKSISARNILTGKITSIIAGAINEEITIDLSGGSTVTSIITSASVTRLGLAVGKTCSAIIKASDVIVATT